MVFSVARAARQDTRNPSEIECEEDGEHDDAKGQCPKIEKFSWYGVQTEKGGEGA